MRDYGCFTSSLVDGNVHFVNSDGLQWYDICASGDDHGAWIAVDPGGTVQCAVSNPDEMAPPVGMRILFIEGGDAGSLRGKTFDGAGFSPPAATVTKTITRRQCAYELFSRGLLSEDSAALMAAAGLAPASMALSDLSPEDRVHMRVSVAEADYQRGSEVLVRLLAGCGLAPGQFDEFFHQAARR